MSKTNMTDFILVVEDSQDWHSRNLAQNPKDYAGLMAFLGPKALSKLQDNLGAKCYFNTLIPYEEGLIKYGVIRYISKRNWRYLSGAFW